MNRAPGPRDPWFKDHQNSCNGTFIKVKEPENYGKKKKKGEGKTEKRIEKGGKIHLYFLSSSFYNTNHAFLCKYKHDVLFNFIS